MAKHYHKTAVNFWLDVFLLLNFLALCWCSVVVRYVFPLPMKSEGYRLWGLDYLAWADVQFGLLCVLSADVLLHVMLHWTWVCGVVESWLRRRKDSSKFEKKADSGNRTLWGVGLLIVILNVLGLAIAAAALSVQGPTP